MIGEALALNTTLTAPSARLTQAPALLLRPSDPLHATTSPPLSEGCGSAYISVHNHPLPPILSLSLQPPFSSSLAKRHLSLHLKFVSHPLFHHCNPPSATPVPSRLLPVLFVLAHCSSHMLAASIDLRLLLRRHASPQSLACMLRSWPRLLTSGSACGLSSTVLAAVLAAHVMADGRAAADLAEARLAIVLADGAAAADLARASNAAVLTDGGAADGASASYVTVLADGGAAADLARASNAAVLTDGGAAAALARASSAVVFADARAPAFSAEVLFTGVRALLADRGHSPLVPVLARGCLLRLPAPPAIAPHSCSWNRLKQAAATRLSAHNLRLSFKLPAAWPLSSFPLEINNKPLLAVGFGTKSNRYKL